MARSSYLPFSLLLLSTTALASEQSTLAFSLDNDGVFGVDQDYTNGIFLTYTSAGIRPPSWVGPLSLSFWGAASLDKWEVTLAHKMYTPSDIEAVEPLQNDRPYAGYLHTEFNYISLHPMQAQRFNLTLGTVGENSLSEEAQKFVHSITGSDDPNGWANQVDEGFAGSVGYLTHINLWREPLLANTEWEVSSVSEANVGNFRSDVSTGVMLRWGQDLSGSLGAANIDNENPFRAGMLGGSKQGWFVFAGIEARYRFNDITIEGDRPGIRHNPDVSDPSLYDVTLDKVQATAVAGFAWYNQSFGATLATTVKTPDYKEAPDSVYGAGGINLYAFF
ncbi:lipid A deacylase LpxR family protein [Vibrio cholerae]